MYRDRLREQKEKAGLTTQELSRLSGVPTGTINKLLSGETESPRYDTMQALEQVFADIEKQMVREEAVYQIPYEEQDTHTLEEYRILSDHEQVELIDGHYIHMQSPTARHQKYVGELFYRTKRYIEDNQGTCQVFMAPLDVQLDCDDKTVVQPDFMVVCDEKKVQYDRIYGAPDWIAEVTSPSTRNTDFYIKVLKYMNAGVREYWIIDLIKERVICYDWANNGLVPEIYPLKEEIPVRIYDGKLRIML